MAEDKRFHLAIPADFAWDIASQIVDKRQVTKAHFGVTGSTLSPEEAGNIQVAGGARINRPSEGSPAARALLRADDVIIEFDENPVISYNDLVVEIRHHRPGDQVAITYIRNGDREMTLATLSDKVEAP